MVISRRAMMFVLVLAAAMAAMASMATAPASAAVDCKTYSPGTHLNPFGDGWEPQPTYTVPDKFGGRDYRGCLALTSDYPKYKGWAGHSMERPALCNTGDDPRPNPPPLIQCLAYAMPWDAWKWTSTGFKKVQQPQGKVYIHPYGTHSGWRWFYKDGSWYASEASHLRLVWYYPI